MSAEVIDVRNRLVDQAKERLIDNAAVIISALAVLIAAGGLLLGGVAMYISFNAAEDAKISTIYIQKLHADLIAQGFDPPPLEGEK